MSPKILCTSLEIMKCEKKRRTSLYIGVDMLEDFKFNYMGRDVGKLSKCSQEAYVVMISHLVCKMICSNIEKERV